MSRDLALKLLSRWDPTQSPELLCGCGFPAVCRTARTPRNPMRKFFSCDVCRLWIWEDLLNKYAGDVVDYFNSNVLNQGMYQFCFVGCGRHVHPYTVQETSSSKQGVVSRSWFHCQNCNLMIPEDTLSQYIEGIIFYRQSSTVDALKAQLQWCQEVISGKDKELAAWRQS